VTEVLWDPGEGHRSEVTREKGVGCVFNSTEEERRKII
jgi:hypothetical protein